jgi:hypothetical protein
LLSRTPSAVQIFQSSYWTQKCQSPVTDTARRFRFRLTLAEVECLAAIGSFTERCGTPNSMVRKLPCPLRTCQTNSPINGANSFLICSIASPRRVSVICQTYLWRGPELLYKRGPAQIWLDEVVVVDLYSSATGRRCLLPSCFHVGCPPPPELLRNRYLWAEAWDR